VPLIEGRKEEDVFPTYYRANSISATKRLGEKCGFRVEEIRMLVSSAACAVVPPLATLELVWIRILMTRPLKPLRTNVIAILGKE
jgi:hypothetical protein